MGLHFGQLAKIRGVIHYKLSPYEQRAFAGMITKGVPNTIRRIRESILPIGIPFTIGYLVYDWASTENKRLSRKNPADYANDV